MDSDKVNVFRVAFLLVSTTSIARALEILGCIELTSQIQERMCPVATGLGSTFNETASRIVANAGV